MKKLIFYFLLLASYNLYSQTNYDKGFEAGFKKGYCYDNLSSCIAPIPPIAPIPKITESANNYNDGYNRGFITGQKVKKNESTSNSVLNTNYKLKTSSYKPLSYDEILSVPLALQRRYNQNQRYLYEMKRWILDLKGAIREKSYIDRLNAKYRALKSLEDKDLARATKLLKKTEIDIREIISEYKNHLNNPSTNQVSSRKSLAYLTHKLQKENSGKNKKYIVILQ